MNPINTIKLPLAAITLTLLINGCGGSTGAKEDNNTHGLLNTPPVAKNLTVNLDEDTIKNITLKAIDEDKDPLTYKITKQPSNGKLQGTPPNITYIPNRDFFGKDSFTYIAIDDKGAESKEAKVDLTIEQTATVKNLELKVDKLSLNKDTNTTFTLTPTLSKGKVTQKLKDALKNPEFLVTPKDAVKIDYKTKTITALKDTNVTIQAKIANTLSNKIKLNIYWEVNGHRLPPEPDPKVNNATLLGVDSNNNGVRDDVERWIYERYKDKHPINAAIAMEAAKVYQKIIAHPERAKELLLESRTIGDCEAFLQYNSNPKIKAIFPHEVDDKYFRRTIIFNTEERKKNYEIYAYLLSGSVFSSGTDEEWRNACKHYPKIWKMIKEIEK